jgi:hypothetical protein
MAKLMTVGGHSFDPNRVMTVGRIGGVPEAEITAITPILINVNMGEWTASYQIVDPDLTIDELTRMINEERD